MEGQRVPMDSLFNKKSNEYTNALLVSTSIVFLINCYEACLGRYYITSRTADRILDPSTASTRNGNLCSACGDVWARFPHFQAIELCEDGLDLRR